MNELKEFIKEKYPEATFKKKHSALVHINGINKVMRIYEHLIIDIPEEEVKIVEQHNGTYGKIVFVFSEPMYKDLMMGV